MTGKSPHHCLAEESAFRCSISRASPARQLPDLIGPDELAQKKPMPAWVFIERTKLFMQVMCATVGTGVP